MTLRTMIGQRLLANRTLLTNTGALFGTTFVTSGLGFVYWWVAARVFPLEAVGLASAMVAAMMLLSTAGKLGLGILLVGELPRHRKDAGTLITGALTVTGAASGLMGIAFALISPRFSPEFSVLSESWGHTLLFALGVVFTTTTLVLDQALIGLLRGGLQLWRNVLFSFTKVVILGLVGLWLEQKTGVTIYITWMAGNALSVVLLTGLLMLQGKRVLYTPQWSLLRTMGGDALKHYALDLTLQTPGYILPILVTVLLSAGTNAYFYAAWMIAGFIFAVPGHLTLVLFAVGSVKQAELARRIRFTIPLCFAGGAVASVLLLLGAPLMLRFFGPHYADNAADTLKLLGFAIFPLVIKSHYIAICRSTRSMMTAVRITGLGAVLEILFASVGALTGGLVGLSLGWLAAITLEALLMLPTVYNLMTVDMPPLDLNPQKWYSLAKRKRDQS